MTAKPTLEQRTLTGLDRFISRVDERLRQLAGQPEQSPASSRPSPALAHQEPSLNARERDHAGALMRVNHMGEVCEIGRAHV